MFYGAKENCLIIRRCAAQKPQTNEQESAVSYLSEQSLCQKSMHYRNGCA
jgi:hypothetical protein